MGFIDQERVKRQQAAAAASEVLAVLKKELDPQVYQQLKLNIYAERIEELTAQSAKNSQQSAHLQLKVEKYNQQTQKWEKFNAKPVQQNVPSISIPVGCRNDTGSRD